MINIFLLNNIMESIKELLKQVQDLMESPELNQKLKEIKDVIKKKNEAAKKCDPLSDIEFIDGIVKPSASRR